MTQTEKSPPVHRGEHRFESGGVFCAATVFRPASSAADEVPAVVIGHGFGGVRAARLFAYAQRFAEAGYVAVTFDYRHFGDSDGEPRQLLDIGRQLDDWRSAVAFTRGLAGVDADRVIGWGTSFGGGHVISLAAAGQPLVGIIAQVPHVSGPAALRAAGLRHAIRVGPLALVDAARSLLGAHPLYVDSVGAPGTRAVMVSPDARAGHLRLLDESGLTDDDVPLGVTARVLLQLSRYSPGRRAAKVTVPALVQVAARDAVTPVAPTKRAAHKMRQATVTAYDAGHFDLYVSPLFDSVVADQIAFLRRVAPTARTV